ncbi:MAG: acyl-ACP--UDP-N-acetylglucosamine O-acyltransferase [Phycisphaerales bacterium]|nr:MAG: acyl-ACP--UDP-N-acetylglucosamine O-acyltransferase [Phycisphaerales bacterium]
MADIHPTAVIESNAQLEKDVTIGPNCYVGGGVTIGSGTILDANVVIEKDVTIGKDNHFYPACVIGCTPQVLGLGPDSNVGKLVIGDRNTFHEHVTIHPSRHYGSATRIGDDNFLMVGAHIGHDCTFEDKLVISNDVHIGGHCRMESGAWIGGVGAVHQFVTVGKWSFVCGLAGVTQDVPPFLIVSGHIPVRVRGVNKRGLQRAGLNQDQQEKICRAYRELYRRGGTLLARAQTLAQEHGLDENVKAMTDAIINSSKHRFGRYLETLRK